MLTLASEQTWALKTSSELKKASKLTWDEKTTSIIFLLLDQVIIEFFSVSFFSFNYIVLLSFCTQILLSLSVK